MSLRNRLVLPIVLVSIGVLGGCGSGNSFTKPVPPPNGSFSNSNLNGTYVFSVSGTDAAGAPYAIVGSFTANGSGGNGQGGITGGTLDLNDPGVPPLVSNAAIGSGSTYKVNVDGRGQATLNTTTAFGNITLDFVLQDSSHGLVTEFDGNGTGSGTLDIQTAGISPVGSYAFIFFGMDVSSGFADPFATVGNFTVGTGGAISGLEDFNDNIFAYTSQGLSGQVVSGPATTPATTLVTTQFGTQTYDVYPIDASHLKFIEMDATATLSGDAYSQTSTSVPTGALAFTVAGAFPSNTAPSVVGGYMVTDGAGNITAASTQDANIGGTVSQAPISFTAQYTAAGTGRFTLGNFAGFSAGSLYAAYPSSGGLLLLEIDNGGVMSGAAYPPQTSTNFNQSAGYGLNFSGVNLVSNVEVDDVAEFASSSSGAAVSGIVDENFAPGGFPNYGLPLSGTYVVPDANGRGQIAANAGNNSNSTLNGGFGITFYSVDGTTFPFVETDANGQVATGVFFAQDATASASSAAKARPHMFVVQPSVRPSAARWRKK
jgi:hypothetical protein